ncbi:ECF transporter S component [Clostridium thermarum]|uniref:ECF transporter S component n=1 Tax=Clostridium thermarum TaxID=1716543 RepID=UPI0013D73CC4|nr:ECF transporter S component [Clostridium thermarum]
MDREKIQAYTRKIVFTGIIIAMALAVRTFSQMIYIGGVPAMRVGISGIFSKVPALLFGPLFGGLSGAVVDIVGFLMNPMGAYLPWYTLTAVLSGVLTAILWQYLERFNAEKFQKLFIVIFVLIGAAGLINHISVDIFPESFWGKIITSIGKNKYNVIYGFEILSAVGILLFLIDSLIRKKYKVEFIHKYSLKLLIAVGISGLIETTINTYLIINFWTGNNTPAFVVFLIPRVIEQIGQTIIQAYTIPFILYAYEKFGSKR